LWKTAEFNAGNLNEVLAWAFAVGFAVFAVPFLCMGVLVLRAAWGWRALCWYGLSCLALLAISILLRGWTWGQLLVAAAMLLSVLSPFVIRPRARRKLNAQEEKALRTITEFVQGISRDLQLETGESEEKRLVFLTYLVGALTTLAVREDFGSSALHLVTVKAFGNLLQIPPEHVAGVAYFCLDATKEESQFLFAAQAGMDDMATWLASSGAVYGQGLRRALERVGDVQMDGTLDSPRIEDSTSESDFTTRADQ
jgi:hypothetical protein